jgi:hypothetical protein
MPGTHSLPVNCRTERERERETEWMPFLSAFAKLRKATISFVFYVCLSVLRMEKLRSTGRTFIKLYISTFFENLLGKFNFLQNQTIIDGSLHETLRTL